MTLESITITSSTSGSTPVTASIDVDKQFSTNLVGGVPNTCQTIIQAANTSGSKTNFMNIYEVDQIKANLTRFNTSISGLNPNLVVSGDYEYIDGYLTNLEKTQIPMQKLVAACLSEEVAPDTRKLDLTQREYETSKARHESITREDVSYYEGWFPLYRPVKESSLFILFGVSICFLVLATLMFLSGSNIYLKIELPRQYEFSYGQTDYTSYLMWGAFIGAILAAIGVYAKWF